MFVKYFRDLVEVGIFVVISGINCQSVELEFQMNGIMEIKVRRGENFASLFFIDAGGIRMLKLHDDRFKKTSLYVGTTEFVKDNLQNIDKRSRAESRSKSSACYVSGSRDIYIYIYIYGVLISREYRKINVHIRKLSKRFRFSIRHHAP